MKFGFKIENLSYLPRWIVLIMDLFFVFVAGFVTFYSFKGLNLHYIRAEYFYICSTFYLVINIFFFWVYRTYSGIIRHSSYVDALKIFFSQFFAFSVILVLNYLIEFIFHVKIFLNTGLIINGFFSFCFLFLYRIVVKQGYEYFYHSKSIDQLPKVLIYGSDNNAIALANSLKTESPKRFKVVGFIDRTDQNATKRILDLPILHQKKSVAILLRMMGSEALIIADKSLSKEERTQIVENCLEYNFKVYTIPLVADLEGKEGISKSIKNFQILDLLERKPIVLDNEKISKQLRNKTIVVTGAAGSIGSEIVRQILSFEPKKIIAIDQSETALHNLSLEIYNKYNEVQIVYIIADIRNKNKIQKIFEKYKPQVVYHAAAYKHVPLMEDNPDQAILTNVMGTKHLADLSLEYGVDRFVMVSTDKAVNPSNVMGASKRIAEKYVQSFDYHIKNKTENNQVKFITTRFGNVLGSNGSVVPLFTKQIQEGGPITITHPEIIRYFMTIPEACQLVLEAGAMGAGGEIFIFDMGEPVKIIDLAKKMIRLAGLLPEKDIKIKVIGLRPGEKLYEELLTDTSKNLSTHHEKIMIAQDMDHNYSKLCEDIEELILSAKENSSKEVVKKMKKIVPEFKSMNSVYVSLD